MDLKIFIIALCTLGAISSIHGYHILYIFPIPTSSQNLLAKVMVNALLKADHEDIQNILDSSTNGVVYFSMGSILKSSGLQAETKQSLLELLGELPYTVLWKFEEELKDLPKNVHVKAWMPQAAILSHNNTKLFITHGGLLSTLEALRYGVPLLAVPVFGDQHTNEAQAARLGYAIKVEFDDFKMADNLRPALKEMISNDSYYKQAKYLSNLFNNRPVPPSELISHYVKLAIETKGAHHLCRSSP